MITVRDFFLENRAPPERYNRNGGEHSQIMIDLKY